METIPDTGGGLSGFIASIIWQVYRYFPSSGRWDWLLLFFALAGLGIALFWPYLWKAVAADMRLLANQEYDVTNQEIVLFLWGQVWQWLLIGFFYTHAGQTLLFRRELFGWASLSEVSRVLFWISLVINFVVMIVLANLGANLDERAERLASGAPMPFAERSLLNIYCGGGIFYTQSDDGSLDIETVGMFVTFFLAVSFLAHVFYWYWSAASILMMATVSCTAILNEVVRMTFVYIQHRRTFG